MSIVFKPRNVDNVIYAVEIKRSEGTVQFVARLPEYCEISPTDEFALRQRLHDAMRTALEPLFRKYQAEDEAAKQRTEP